MAEFFEKTWVKRTLSGISYLYGALLVWLVWASLAYEMSYDNANLVFIVYLLINFIFSITLFLSRKVISTAILVMLLVPVSLGILLLNFGNWFMIAPPVLIVIFMFFAVRAHDTLKMILGTIYLLMYVLSILGYIAVSTIFSGGHETVRTQEVASPNGLYRYVVYEGKDGAANRAINIYVEPNTNDIDLKLVQFKETMRAKREFTGKFNAPPAISWQEEDLLVINDKKIKVGEIRWKDISILSNLFG